MLSRTQLVLTRRFRCSAIRGNTSGNAEKKIAQLESAMKTGPLEEVGKFPGMPKYVPNALDKLFLVWSGHYKTMADVPSRVEAETMHKAKTWGRIRVNIGMILFGVCVSLFMVYSGKNAAKHGITVEQQNLQWHKKINEQHQAEQRNANKQNE